MSSGPTYTFQDNKAIPNGHGKKHKRAASRSSVGSKSSKEDDQSLTYSASTSGSSTGESTDSSFAEIRKALEHMDDEAVSKMLGGLDNETTAVPQTICGQPSDSHDYDGGGHGSAVFAPANPEEPIKNRSLNSDDKSSAAASRKKEKLKKTSTPPPRQPIRKNDWKEMFYTHSWMCGFADAFNFSRSGKD